MHAEAPADAALLQRFSDAVDQMVRVAVQGVHQLDLASAGSSPVCAYVVSPESEVCHDAGPHQSG